MNQSVINALRNLVNALEADTSATEETKAGAVAALSLINPHKPYGTALFDALARLTITVTPELVILRATQDGSKEVLLRQRGPDEAYPNQWHAPGSAVRPGETIMRVTERATRECDVSLPSPVFRGYDNDQHEERGHFLHLVYAVDVTGIVIPTHAKLQWFSVDALPESTVEHHRQVVIPMALGRYRHDEDLESFAL